jgi:hypothetical protein
MELRKFIATTIREYLNEQIDNFTDITLYHGTNNDFDNFDIEKSGLIQYSDWGKGIYFTRSKSQAHQYRIDAVKKLNKEYNDAYEEYEKTEKEFKNTKYGTQEHKDLYDLTFVKLKDFQNVGKQLNSTKEGRLVTAKIKPNAKIYRYNSSSGMTDPYLSNDVKSKGYDIILVDKNRYTEEFVVINPNSIIITGEIKDN